MFAVGYKIKIGRYLVNSLDSVTITKSVENLSDSATIVLPGTNINKALQVEDKIKEGDKVEIWIGYNDSLQLEFSGYLNYISTDDAAIRLDCEDALHQFRVALKDIEYKTITLKNLLQNIVNEVNNEKKITFSVLCDYDFSYDKFVVFKATAFDVLKKIQDETKANIYFKENVLHLHPQYSKVFNSQSIIYDFAINIEKSELKYILEKNKKVEVEVNSTKPDGTKQKVTYGTPGGTKVVREMSSVSEASMRATAEQEYQLYSYDGFEGNFTAWLTPFCEPGYKIELRDGEYPEKNGVYYVVSVETKFSSSGGERTITIGRKIG